MKKLDQETIKQHDQTVQSFIELWISFSDLDYEAKSWMAEAFMNCSKEQRQKLKEHIMPAVEKKKQMEYNDMRMHIEEELAKSKKSFMDYGIINIIRNEEFSTIVLWEETDAKGRPNNIGYSNPLFVYSTNKQLFEWVINTLPDLRDKQNNPF